MGCTIHCRSWLVVIALMVGMKALLEPGMSTLYFCKREGNVVRGGDEVVVGGSSKSSKHHGEYLQTPRIAPLLQSHVLHISSLS